MKIFCLPYSGTGASLFRKWPNHYEHIKFVKIQYAGKENRFKMQKAETFETLAHNVIEEYLIHENENYALFGHCSSALLAYEISLQLESRNVTAFQGLYISAQSSPDNGPTGPLLLKNDTELGELIAQKLGKSKESMNPSYLGLLVKDFREDIEMHREYQKKYEAIQASLYVIGWDQDEYAPIQSLKGWSSFGEAHYKELEGGHYRFKDAPEELLRCIAQNDFQ